MELSRCGRKTKLFKAQLDAVYAALSADPSTRMQELHERLHLPCTLRALYNIAKKMGFTRPTPRLKLPSLKTNLTNDLPIETPSTQNLPIKDLPVNTLLTNDLLIKTQPNKSDGSPLPVYKGRNYLLGRAI